MSTSRRYKYAEQIIEGLEGKQGEKGEKGESGAGYEIAKVYFKDVEAESFQDSNIVLTVDFQKTIENGCNMEKIIQIEQGMDTQNLKNIRIKNPKPLDQKLFITEICVNLETNIPNLVNYNLDCDLVGIDIKGDTLKNVAIGSQQLYRQYSATFGPVNYNLTALTQNRTLSINYANIYNLKITKNVDQEQFPVTLGIKNICLIVHIYDR
jgi:hypothetical protein